MKVFTISHIPFGLPEGHRFPIDKYLMLEKALLEQNIIGPQDIIEAPLVEIEKILLAHSESYLQGVLNGTLPPKVQKRIGFPWSENLPFRSRGSVGAFVEASEVALREGLSATLCGGTHHAQRELGAGFCVFNDFAIAALSLLHQRKVDRVLILDLDVHQGDGNAEILKDRSEVFTFSMHGKDNFPFRKIPSDWDIELPTGTGDEAFLDHLRGALDELTSFRPDIVFYQAGVDGLKSDAFGKLALTHEGLKKRDHMVLEHFKEQAVPLAMALGGGYSNPIEETIKAHTNCFQILKNFWPAFNKTTDDQNP